ncbi:MAG TPA: hypothetical protein PKI19_10280 [Elusimicrobiales bacterium]|nr:hypothetical protein [Elusimicrobiales bacterium]
MRKKNFLPVCLAALLPAAAVAAGSAPTAADASSYAAAITLDRAGKKQEAAEELKKALKIKPANVPYLNMLGSLYYDLGKYPEAVKNLESAQKHDPKKVWHYYLAKSLLKVGRVEDARKAAATASRLEPQQGRQLEMIKLGEKIKNYRAIFAAAKAAAARQDYASASSELKTARGLIDTEEAKKLEADIAGDTAALGFLQQLAAARQALEKRDLAAARSGLNAARRYSDTDETRRLDAAISKAEAFQKHMTSADTMLNYKKFKEARAEAAQALALFPRDEAKEKLAEIDKAEQNELYLLHFNQAKAILQKNADYAAALAELKLALDISATDEAREFQAGIVKLQDGQSYKLHWDRAAELLQKKDYDAALAEFKAAAAVVKTDEAVVKISETARLRDARLRNKLLLKLAAGLGLLAVIFGTVRLLLGRRRANHSLAALANIIEAMRLSDFRKAMLEYADFKAAGGRPEDIPSGELFAVFSGAGALDKLSAENVSAGYLLECAARLAGENKTAEAFLVLGGGAVLKKIRLAPDFAAFINVYTRAGRLADIGTLVEQAGFGPEIYSGLAAAMLDLGLNEQGVRVLQAKRKFHELQKLDSDLLFAFTRKPGA